jgi:hypothetical protein
VVGGRDFSWRGIRCRLARTITILANNAENTSFRHCFVAP